MVIELFIGAQTAVDVGALYFIFTHRKEVETFISTDLKTALTSLQGQINIYRNELTTFMQSPKQPEPPVETPPTNG